MDDEVRAFLDGFRDRDARFLSQWLPRYGATVEAIATALEENDLERIFDLIWKTVDNSISNVGQGVLKFEIVDRMHDELLQVIRDISQDSSPEAFERIAERFEGWKRDGRIPMVPRLMIARAFAGLDPRNYHTTVDARSQNHVLGWFAGHTGFVPPTATSWAVRASALVAHIDRLGIFGDDFLVRNMFPWFVMDQLRARDAPEDVPPGHIRRPASAFADLPPQKRLIRLRHNEVQDALYEKLVSEFGANHVWTEHATGTGGYADALARHPDKRCQLYEIKIAESASGVVRQALGQLLEYSYRSGGLEPIKLFAVGEPALDNATRDFLARLRTDFRLDIDYLQIRVASTPA